MPLSITTELGRFEEFFSEVVYPAWPVWLIAGIAAIAAACYFAYRRGWHHTLARHILLSSAIGAVLIAALGYAGYYTISPLFDRNTVCEASPIHGAGSGSDKCGSDAAIAATMPPTGSPEPGVAPTHVPAAAVPTAAPISTPFAARIARHGVWQSADDFHFTIGDALLIESAPGAYTLRVENFSVRNGPDVYVLLSPNNDYGEGVLNLGSLKGTDGAFNYDIPPGTDVTKYQSAIIWCKQFDVLFGHAELT